MASKLILSAFIFIPSVEVVIVEIILLAVAGVKDRLPVSIVPLLILLAVILSEAISLDVIDPERIELPCNSCDELNDETR